MKYSAHRSDEGANPREVIEFGGFRLSLAARALTKDGAPVSLLASI